MRLPPARATIAIVGATALAWMIGQSAHLEIPLAALAGFIPARFSLDLVIPDAVPAVFTPLTATLVHAGIVHLTFNLLMIGFCGRYVEASLGAAGFLTLYLVGACAAAGAQYLVAPQSVSPMIGASGAGSAVLAAYALLYGQNRVKGWGPGSARILNILWLAGAWIGLQALLGFSTGGLPGVPAGGAIATAAHVGGFLAGLLLARPLLKLRYRSA